jgi:hypothetical protein
MSYKGNLGFLRRYRINQGKKTKQKKNKERTSVFWRIGS